MKKPLFYNGLTEDYLDDLYDNSSDFIKGAYDDAANSSTPIHLPMMSARLVAMLTRMNSVRNAVEIGTFTAFTTLNIANAMDDDGHLITIEHDAQRLEMAQKSIARAPDNIRKKVSLRHGDAKDICLTLPGPYDMIFIDADKPSYNIYLDWAEETLGHGGLLIVDNTLLSGGVYTDELPHRIRQSTANAMQDFNKRIATSEVFESVLLPLYDGLTIARKI